MVWLSIYNTKDAAWVDFPAPKKGSGTYTFSTYVDGGRNAEGNFIGATVGADKMKFECSWAALSGEEFRTLLYAYDKDRRGSFINKVRIYDPRVGSIREINMYVGDRNGTPIMDGKWWTDVSANLIEV